MTLQQRFLDACSEWICDGYSADLRYFAAIGSEGPDLLAGVVSLHPLPPSRDLNLSLRLGHVAAGQVQLPSASKSDLLDLVATALLGELALSGQHYVLRATGSELRHAEPRADDWFTPLRMNIHGVEPHGIADRLAYCDDALRSAEPPFDGLRDLLGWLDLEAPQPGRLTTLAVQVSPPVDLIYDQCSLSDEKLRLTLHAHPNFNPHFLHLGVVILPRDGLNGRVRASHAICWGDIANGRREGVLELDVPKAESALTMLVLGARTVRRQWFQDPSRAANSRLVAAQHFDRDLRMIRQALFESNDSPRFEAAVGALLFLLGFAPAVQLETDAPDLIASTPSGKIVLIECTLRLADAASKVGKLIGRSVTAEKTLQTSGHYAGVVRLLVCRASRAELRPQRTLLREAGAFLVAGEELNEGLLRTRFRQDPDRLLQELAEAQAEST